jgi:hypothetical protein
LCYNQPPTSQAFGEIPASNHLDDVLFSKAAYCAHLRHRIRQKSGINGFNETCGRGHIAGYFSQSYLDSVTEPAVPQFFRNMHLFQPMFCG